jgi:uncharacterized protein (DUF1684 family)
MTEVRYKGKSPEQRIADRYKPSNAIATANVHTHFGDGPTRVVSTHHWAGNQAVHSNPHSKSLTDLRIRQTGDTDGVDNRRPTAGSPIMGQKR